MRAFFFSIILIIRRLCFVSCLSSPVFLCRMHFVCVTANTVYFMLDNTGHADLCPELLGLDHGMAHSSLLQEFSIVLPEFRGRVTSASQPKSANFGLKMRKLLRSFKLEKALAQYKLAMLESFDVKTMLGKSVFNQ